MATGESVHPLQLSTYLRLIVQAVAAVPTVWLVAEVSAAKYAPSGHLYLDLVERDIDGKLVAQCRGNLWRPNLKMVTAFEKATGLKVGPGIKLLLKVSANYHPAYGLSLIIQDIDPSYTLGDMALKLQRMREALKAEHLYENCDRYRFHMCPIVLPSSHRMVPLGSATSRRL